MGLFYTALSRATTLGGDDGLHSAIYFTGTEFKESRIRNIGKRCGSVNDYIPIQKRTQWVAHLKKRTRRLRKPDNRMKKILKWASETTINNDELYNRISEYVRANHHRRPETFGNIRL
jgi:hypothetical protein